MMEQGGHEEIMDHADIYPEKVDSNLTHSNGATASSAEAQAANTGQASSSGWYPGKYVAAAFRKGDDPRASSSERVSEPSGSTNSTSSTTTSTFSRLTSMMSLGSTNKAAPGTTTVPLEEGLEDRDKDETEDEKKNEHMIVSMVRKIRNKMIARKLTGSIFVHRLSGIVVTKMTCAVSEDDLESEEVSDQGNAYEDDMSGNYKRALTTTDAVLNSLERRSRAWDGVSFRDDITLTRGVTVGVSDPIVGFIGFSWTFEITATVKSLLASRKRFEAARDAYQREHPSQSLSTRGMSFSFSFSSSNASQAQQKEHQQKLEQVLKEGAIAAQEQQALSELQPALRDSDDDEEGTNSGLKEV